jgi:hypothetical protein
VTGKDPTVGATVVPFGVIVCVTVGVLAQLSVTVGAAQVAVLLQVLPDSAMV